jgi:hypothetical protein
MTLKKMALKFQKLVNRDQEMGSQTVKKISFFFDKSDSWGGHPLSGLADE